MKWVSELDYEWHDGFPCGTSKKEVIQDNESNFAVFDGRKYGGDIILYRQNRE